MIDSSRLWHLGRYVLPAVILVWILLQLGSHETSRFSRILGAHRNEKTVFVDDFLRLEVDGEFNGSSIATLCSNKTWTPDIITTCEAIPGGLGDVKSGILNCIRTAIEMGSSVVLPSIMLRSRIDLADAVTSDAGPRRGVSLDHFFDHTHLRDSLATFCPQMPVYDSLDGFYNKPTMIEATKVDIFRLKDMQLLTTLSDKRGQVLAQPERLGAQINAFLDSKSPRTTRGYPFHVHLRPTPQFLFPASTFDPPDLYANFGRLLRVRTDLRRLAAAALFNLHMAFDLPLDLRSGIHADTFAAVELRTEADATINGFPSYTVQASDALSFLTANNRTLAFLGTGAKDADTEAFVQRAAEFGITVVTKPDLLEGADAALLGTLSWDQRGLVDYELMMHAGLFEGTAHSSFAWNVALRREHAFGTPGLANSSHLDGHIRWYDQYSTIYGQAGIGDFLHKTIWP